ncbi:MAG: dependent epimerase/dehydratase family protein [Burkholderiales bacterium]|nr:dependent epimerase/dehydratase family protein [Burkholderiales bacterium]
MNKVALVAGASGLIGRRIAANLVSLGWEVIGLARRPPDGPAQRSIAVDLSDASDSRVKLSPLDKVTHVFYAARYEHPEGIPESEALNTAMLRNVLDGITGASPLSHVNLVHGTKYYGHPGPIPMPVTEASPRGSGPTFYFAQEDLVRDRAAAARWTWSAARPHIFCDSAPHHPRSIGLVIAVFAAIQRELGQPLFFPGSERSFNARTQFTDTGLLARALEWMATEPRCANQAFNVVNGDAPRWRELWPQFARVLGTAAGGPRGISLAQYMADKAPVWQAVMERYHLHPTTLDRIVLWDYGDYVFRPEWDIMSSMNKARRCGFDERVDTTEMFARVFAYYREQRIIP